MSPPFEKCITPCEHFANPIPIIVKRSLIRACYLINIHYISPKRREFIYYLAVGRTFHPIFKEFHCDAPKKHSSSYR
jgi:hypothetical protein